MDQEITENITAVNAALTTNIFFVSEINSTLLSLTEEVQKNYNFTFKKCGLTGKENEVLYAKMDRSNSPFNFFVSPSFVHLEKYIHLFKICKRNLVFLIYGDLSTSAENYLLKSKQEFVGANFIFEGFLLKTKQPMNDKDILLAEKLQTKILTKNVGVPNPIFDIIFKEKKCLFESTPRKAKAKKVFNIVKVPHTKKLVRNAVKLVKLRSPFSKTSTLNSSNKNSKTSRIDDDDKDDNFNSLIRISKEVFEFIKSKGEVSGQHVTLNYQQVTEYMQNQIGKKNSDITFKNIQRRVYDAINVISAVGLISKKKNNLVYDGVFQIYETKSLEKINVLVT